MFGFVKFPNIAENSTELIKLKEILANAYTQTLLPHFVPQFMRLDA
jgi:hypothetical protein